MTYHHVLPVLAEWFHDLWSALGKLIREIRAGW